MDVIIEPIAADIEEVAQIVLEDQFTDIMNNLSFEDIIKTHILN